MGRVSRLMILLRPPLPAIRPSIALLNRRLFSLRASPLRLLNMASPSKARLRSCQIASPFHSQTRNNSYAFKSTDAAGDNHPWPEWTHFLRNLLNGQGFAAPEDYRIPPEDAFVAYKELPEDFVKASASCIAFSRTRPDLLGLLSRRDIEAVVSNGTPFLFKSALDTARRMRAFLGTDSINGADLGAASTVDLMKYILSYASNPTLSSERNGLCSREVVDSSVQNLLRELVTISSGVSGGNVASPDQQFSYRYQQTSRPFGQHIQMKRGDWICTKCNFMNFARNMKCLECEESRPRNILSGGEWECPECSFFNYGRNTSCLRCNHRKPGAPLFNNNNSHQTSEQNGGTGFSRPPFQTVTSDFQYGSSSNSSSISGVVNRNISENFHFPKDSASRMDSRNQENEQAAKSEGWFKKIAELHNVKDIPNAVSDEDFAADTPMRKGESRFVVGKKKYNGPMDPAIDANFLPGYFSRKDTDPLNVQDSNTAFMGENPSDTLIPDTQMSKYSNHGVADTFTVPRMETKRADNSEVSNGNIGHTSEALRVGNQPFSSSLQGITSTSGNSWTKGDSAFSSKSTAASVGASFQAPESDDVGKSVDGSATKEAGPIDMSEEAKAERWFKRVAQIKNISELSQIPDEDFPSIMPMRKGVNRFVVSKRKTPLERRLTSQQHRRNLPVVTNDSSKKESDSS